MRKLKCSKVGQYKIEKLLGEGVSGRIYLASKPVWGSGKEIKVAIKVLKPGIDVSIFENELSKLLQLSSKYCVRTLGWETTEFGPALILEYVDGVSLLEIMKVGALSRSTAAYLMFQVLKGLREMHNLGLVHGDISPNNIMVTSSGEVKILDFGSILGGDSQLGTKRYLSKNRWAGREALNSDDLFSLVLIYRELWDLDFRLNWTGNWEQRARMLENQVFSSLDEIADGANACCDGEREKVVKIVLSLKAAGNFELSETKIQEHAQKPSGKRNYILLLLLTLLHVSVLRSDEATKTGSLVIRTTKWYEASINGIKYGTAPIRVENLPVGRHKLLLEGERERHHLVIDIHQSKTQRISDWNLSQRH